ncbi:bifunctional diaminohydroxyphosphoribosylaminopyrimidine deaminase/5-amino-6-(5-phosphoribosylamino)uracil reductase RibD [Aliihoeflea aestuarii]|jgi:diaminohydroxyphosphoribosylaminopyrimidine deaminase / 5-amino-6-(5-phosphoribosylamino)uracil reductase|uniref:bifunctional diaminohydroxyphosphoribosylaminopyrimidine deaminase/5-amino-6-(5-phosphoribosylamino)uracil reductase RibD n=1 Tax=Aliihoeflea aestuarii TaxID=453840 RepID=UPI002094F5EE|nr:bifunctional diaminohydroxyphosphoribosylaminopyrimidine deaminase/5-amino-6-(5-phosphoribosylamino)uracil reductase RibD [Aliihoeflea aestuarii]MCO6392699.1 bifunctional diaminohydroxyphosphoribosylaminopyrimidine deaminase/5-amino-6-(5-phosphoribosylamino)uracil reductase RibD [Aliihoeflea aestuarii]
MISADIDRRFMAAAIRLSRRNLGLTGTNPSVGTLIVRDDGEGPRIVGRGVTALGGRPHAEAEALGEAKALARGATAYVTLEPCAHHGRTPPCAEALARAGIRRVVGAAADPDPRVAGRGYAILEAAGIEVTRNVLADEAADLLRGYLTRATRNRPEVTLKLAISADGMIGRRDEGQVAISGPVSRRQSHLLRAESDAILVGIGTAKADDPELTCRLPGLQKRSPIRIVLDRNARLPLASKLVTSARETPVLLATGVESDGQRREALERAGVGFIACDVHDDRIALPELLDDLAARGILTLLVEGGAATARHFLAEGLVDRLVLFQSKIVIGSGGIASPLSVETVPQGFNRVRRDSFGDDICHEYVRHF